jgi:hypothetical protein
MKAKRERQELGTDTPIGSTELGVCAIIHISAKGNSQQYKLGKQKPRFPDVQSYSMKGNELYYSHSNFDGRNVNNLTCNSTRHFAEQGGGKNCKEKFINLITKTRTLQT